jgi:signal recognition particle subunit SRP54
VGRGRLTEENIEDAVRDVRRALIEADVALPVIRDFVARVRERAIGAEVLRSLTPGQAFIKILHEQLTATLGEGVAELNLRHQPPARDSAGWPAGCRQDHDGREACGFHP